MAPESLSALRSLAAAAALVLLAGCATLTKGTTQAVVIGTDPGGAACTITRDGATVAVVDPTPGTITVSKSQADMNLRCTKAGYVDAVGTIGSRFQMMTFGNVLFGGIIGIAIDAASGATTEYEPTITVVLQPVRFPSPEARDAYFDRRRTDFLRESKLVKERIQSLCKGDDCARQLSDADRQEQLGLARIEEQRKAADIGPVAPQ